MSKREGVEDVVGDTQVMGLGVLVALVERIRAVLLPLPATPRHISQCKGAALL